MLNNITHTFFPRVEHNALPSASLRCHFGPLRPAAGPLGTHLVRLPGRPSVPAGISARTLKTGTQMGLTTARCGKVGADFACADRSLVLRPSFPCNELECLASSRLSSTLTPSFARRGVFSPIRSLLYPPSYDRPPTTVWLSGWALMQSMVLHGVLGFPHSRGRIGHTSRMSV